MSRQSSLGPSLPQDCSPDELMLCSVQQTWDMESVGPELDDWTIDNSSPVLGSFVPDMQDVFVAHLHMVVRMTVSSLRTNHFHLHLLEIISQPWHACKENTAHVLTNNVQAIDNCLKIVIIKPIGDFSETIFSNPVKFIQALMMSFEINSDKINEICTNKQSHSIAAKLCRPNQKLMHEVLSVSQICERTVKCQVSLREVSTLNLGILVKISLFAYYGRAFHYIQLKKK